MALVVLTGICLAACPAAGQLNNGSAYTWSTLAGSTGRGAGDGTGSAAQFFLPNGVAVDGAGTIYIADTYNDTIRKITPAGVVTTIAGFAGAPGSQDGANSAARFNQPYGIAADGAGNLYIADTYNSTIRMLAPSGTNWVVTTIAGQVGFAGHADGDGTNAQFGFPFAIASDTHGDLYVADFGNQTIRTVYPYVPRGGVTHWQVATLAGQLGAPGHADGFSTNAQFNFPQGIAVDTNGNVFVADSGNGTIREISYTVDGVTSLVPYVTTIAGFPGNLGSVDGQGTNAEFYRPYGISVVSPSQLYVVDNAASQVRELTSETVMMGMGGMATVWQVSTVAGHANTPGSIDGTGTNAEFFGPTGVAVDATGNAYVADPYNYEIRQVTSAGVVSTLAGSANVPGSTDGTGAAARLSDPQAVAADKAGNIYVADTGNGTIRRITSAGVVSTLAGSAGQQAEADGVGNLARFDLPTGIAVDGSGDLYVADSEGHAIRHVTAAGVVSTLPISGLGADPRCLAIDAHGNIYVANYFGYTIQQIKPPGPMSMGWTIATIAGSAGNPGTADGTNGFARFSSPEGIAVDSSSNIYVADSSSSAIRKIAPVGTNWVVTTIAGGSTTNGLLTTPYGLGIDNAGDLYIGEYGAIQVLTPRGTNWVCSTIGGAGMDLGFGNADGPGNVARFSTVLGISVDNSGTIFAADGDNNTIRKGIFTAFGNANPVPYSPPLMTGSLMVTLIPANAGGQWRFPWEVAWRDSGTIASNLAPDNYTIEYKNIPGYLTLATNYLVGVTNGGTILVTNQYYPTAVSLSNGTGTLTVNMPNAPSGAAWGFLGGSNSLATGYTTNLSPGTYLIGFQPVSGYSTPANLSVQVIAGEPSVITVNYLVASPPPPNVLLPVPAPSAQIGDLTDYPFGFNGQLLSDTGYGSGVAVQTNVVLTAAHVVFNDQTLSYVNQVYWFFRQETRVFSPEPMAARGWYILSGYAAQRTNDLGHGYSVDESSAESRNMDVAALYFNTRPVAGGGFGGYLPSDTVPNQWLSGTTEKMLVGYPVDGSLFGDASIVPGQMYQTLPQPYPLILDPEVVNGQQEVYTADWFLGYPGDSGGPVYVQFNGYYYPAGVYLGILYNGSEFLSLVRGFDSNVVNMVNLAQLQGDNGTNNSGTNNTGGGVIVIIPNAAVSAANPGYIQWKLEPPAAVLAGAAWRLAGDPSYSTATNYTRAVLSTNPVAVQFKPIPGWNLPANQSISVTPNVITVSTGYYNVASPLLTLESGSGIGIIGTTGTTYRIEARTSLTSGAWQPVSTNTITSNGLNLVLPPPTATQSTTFYRAVWLP